jgi:hypothetical protein
MKFVIKHEIKGRIRIIAKPHDFRTGRYVGILP